MSTFIYRFCFLAAVEWLHGGGTRASAVVSWRRRAVSQAADDFVDAWRTTALGHSGEGDVDAAEMVLMVARPISRRMVDSSTRPVMTI